MLERSSYQDIKLKRQSNPVPWLYRTCVNGIPLASTAASSEVGGIPL